MGLNQTLCDEAQLERKALEAVAEADAALIAFCDQHPTRYSSGNEYLTKHEAILRGNRNSALAQLSAVRGE